MNTKDLVTQVYSNVTINAMLQGTETINGEYKNALTETNNLILYGEFDCVLTIDAYHNIFTDYL